MSRLATMGAFSCATIAVSGFKPEDEEREKEFQETGKYTPPTDSVSSFYSSVLYPTSQPLGKTGEYPFSAMMQEIDNGPMKGKFTIAALNAYQQGAGFWPEVLEKWGFELMDKTDNNIGTINYIYVRNLNRVE